MQCVGGLYLTVADSLAPLLINENNKKISIAENKKRLRKFSARFRPFSNKISAVPKTVLSSSQGQGNFRGLEASRPRTSKCVLEAKDVLEDSTPDTYDAW